MVHRVALLFGHVHEVAHIPQVDLLVILVPVFLALVGRGKKDVSKYTRFWILTRRQ